MCFDAVLIDASVAEVFLLLADFSGGVVAIALPEMRFWQLRGFTQ